MVRRAVLSDLPAILSIYESGRLFMHSHGNPHQWIGGYPQESILKIDIADKDLYVLEDGAVYGVFLMTEKPEPTYARIHGRFLTPSPYLTLHRVCGDGIHRGILKEAVAFANQRFLPIRIDTHIDNLPMQRAVLAQGFRFCGVIHLQNGDARLAYERKARV